MPSERNPTLDVETAGGEVVLEKPEAETVNVRIRVSGNGEEFALRVSDRDGSYLDEDPSITGDVDFLYALTERFVKVECITGTGNAGDTADVLLSTAEE